MSNTGIPADGYLKGSFYEQLPAKFVQVSSIDNAKYDWQLERLEDRLAEYGSLNVKAQGSNIISFMKRAINYHNRDMSAESGVIPDENFIKKLNTYIKAYTKENPQSLISPVEVRKLEDISGPHLAAIIDWSEKEKFLGHAKKDENRAMIEALLTIPDEDIQRRAGRFEKYAAPKAGMQSSMQVPGTANAWDPTKNTLTLG